MRRLLSFAKIDFLRARSTLWIVVLPLVAEVFLVFRHRGVDSAAFAIGYMMFMVLIFAALPFKSEAAAEQGFFRMLPAKPGEQVAGHFLFGLFILMAGFVVGLIGIVVPQALFRGAAGVRKLFGQDFALFAGGIFGVALFFLGIEGLVCTYFRFQNARAAAVVRIVPAMIFFFFMMRFSEAESGMSAWQRTAFSFLRANAAPWLVGALGLLSFLVLAWISVRISAGREM